jgi:phosphatidylglycerol:prolipoprotein diacylglycerol transferase
VLTISVNPVAFTIGSLQVRWYGIAIAVAIALLLLIMVREGKRLGIKRDLYGLFLWGILGGLVGGRLAYIIYYWDYFIANPRQIIGFQGLTQMGMIIGIIVAELIYMKVTRMRFSMLLSIGDAFIVGALLALAIGRIGCTLNGCCYGLPSPFHFFPLAVIYTNPNSLAPLDTPLYPTQIYHALWNLIVFATVWQFRGKFKPEGGLLFFGFCIYAIGDLGLRFLRGDRGVILFGGLDVPQVVDFAMFVIFLPWLIVRLRRSQKQALVTEPASGAGLEQSRED